MFDPIVYVAFRLPDWVCEARDEAAIFWPRRFSREDSVRWQWGVYVHETMSRDEADAAIGRACKRAGLRPRPRAAWIEK